MKTLHYFHIILLIFGTACTEVVELDLNEGENNRLVVEGGITTETKAHSIRLTRSTEYFREEPAPVVNNAKVTLSCDGDLPVRLTQNKITGDYETPDDFTGKVGATYSLEIELQNGETYSASATIPYAPEIDSLRLSKMFYSRFREEYGYVVYLFAKEKPGKGDCYLWEYLLNDTLQTDTIREKVFVDDTQVEGQYVHNFDVFWIPNKEVMLDTNVVTVKSYCITTDYYDFLLALLSETDWNGPYSGPPANIPSNISDGALGCFYGADVNSKDILLIKETEPEDE